MGKRHLTYEEIYEKKFEDLRNLVPREAHPYLDRLKGNLRTIEAKYAPLYASASATPEMESDSSFLKVKDPYTIREHLDTYVVGQHDSKKVLSQVSYYHMSHLKREMETGRKNENYIKSSILMIGPTGSGKTLLANTLSTILGVPFVKVDATSMTKTGFVGDSIQDAVRELYYVTDGDMAKAECGIILVDEIDKLAGGSRDDYISNSIVTGKGVQQELLRPMENSTIDIFSQTNINSIREMMQGNDPANAKISTRNILFILAGAFDGLEEVILKRKRKELGQSIGFAKKETMTIHDVSLTDVLPQDLIEYGLIPELVGRITYIVPLERLDEQKLYEVLRDAKGSISQQIENSISKTTGKKVRFSDESLKRIAQQAAEVQTGGRALTEICFRLTNEFMFHLPGLDLEEYTITPEFVDQYLPMTYQLIVRPHIEQSMRKYPFLAPQVDWNDDAIDYIVERMVSKKIDSIHKYVSDFMTAWAPIINNIFTQRQQTVTITRSILETYEANHSNTNEIIFNLLNGKT
ncbi:MAG: AAA family ATPase [SAR324 cluster bacterium]|nr:AAA family ATPase [SAR324 cluster bacterium]